MNNQYTPDYVSAPGETLRETLDALGMSHLVLADRTQIPAETIAKILDGRAAITPEMSVQFERVLVVPATFWDNRQARYHEYLSSLADTSEKFSEGDGIVKTPVGELINS